MNFYNEHKNLCKIIIGIFAIEVVVIVVTGGVVLLLILAMPEIAIIGALI